MVRLSNLVRSKSYQFSVTDEGIGITLSGSFYCPERATRSVRQVSGGTVTGKTSHTHEMTLSACEPPGGKVKARLQDVTDPFNRVELDTVTLNVVVPGAVPPTVAAPTNLVLQRHRTDHDRLVVKSFQRPGVTPQYLQFQLFRTSGTSNDLLRWRDPISVGSDSTTVEFDNVATSIYEWFAVKGGTCEDLTRTRCGILGLPSNLVWVDGNGPPTKLRLATNADDDEGLSLMFAPSGSRNSRFELHESSSRSGPFVLRSTSALTTSSATFENLTKGKWYRARGQNCAFADPQLDGCAHWSEWSRVIELPNTTEPPLIRP